MAMRVIPPDEWRAFFDSFSRQHAGWLVSLEISDRSGTQIAVRSLPLRGIAVDAEDKPSIAVLLGSDPREHFARIVRSPERIVVDQAESGADRAVTVYEAAGLATTVRFRAPMLPEMVDGVGPNEVCAPRAPQPPPEVHPRAIMVPVDFTAPSRKALHYAVALARCFDGHLHVVHVTCVPGEGDTAAGESPGDRLRRFAAPAMGATALTLACPAGTPAYDIVEYAREHGIDLIVIGTHTHGPVGQMTTGSVSEFVIRRAPCPVLVVRDPEHEFVEGAAEKELATPCE